MITLQQWKDSEGDHFTLADGTVLTLSEVSLPLAPAGWECFSLLFSGAVQLEQGELSLNHATLGELSLFLVPVGPLGTTDGTWHFEAVFNRQVANA